MTRPNPIGVHFIFTHQSKPQYQFIHDMYPGILKLVDSSTPDVQEIADAYAAAPNAILYLRNVARSEQHDFLWRDPIGCARQHVAEWHADLEERAQQAKDRKLIIPDRSQMHLLGINEPVMELFARKEDMSNYDEWLAMVKQRAALLDDHMVEFGQQANALGYPVGLGNISSGQPANLKPGEYATFDWFPKTRKFLESTRGKNAYTAHEYWRAETGPEGQADWHAWRFTHLELDADIDILESGVDQQVTSDPPNGNRGFMGHMSAAAYVDQHRRYVKRAMGDARFRCETPFTLNGDKIWESFWIDHCMPEMVALSAELRGELAATPPTPDTIHLPEIKVPDPTPEQPAQPTPAQPAPASLAPIEPRVAQAILAIESAGQSFGPDGRPLIRFEAHIFKSQLHNDALWSQHFQVDTTTPWTNQMWRGDPNSAWQPLHANQASEYAAFDLARSLNADAAYNSISVGSAQIMGFNHARIGYRTAEAMYNAFADGNMQVIGFINYLLSDPDLAVAMSNKDWRTVAAKYNGTGAVESYSKKLQQAYESLGGAV